VIILTAAGNIAIAAGFILWFAGLVRGRPFTARDRSAVDALYCAGCTLHMIGALATGDWTWGIWALIAASAAWSLWDDHNAGRKLRGALSLLGDKSRALRDSLVRRARRAARPSPVLRPSLRGAP
jgi:hypothetical protein